MIALATKIYPKFGEMTQKDLIREEVEQNLTFCGFLVFECPPSRKD